MSSKQRILDMLNFIEYRHRCIKHFHPTFEDEDYIEYEDNIDNYNDDELLEIIEILTEYTLALDATGF